jgi:hypothetical protein
MYPDIMVLPMREELTRVGFEELRTADQVDRALTSGSGTAMVVVNSICGCAAGRMRPAVRAALNHANRPEKLYTVFARIERQPSGRVPISPDTRLRHPRSLCCETDRWCTCFSAAISSTAKPSTLPMN